MKVYEDFEGGNAKIDFRFTNKSSVFIENWFIVADVFNNNHEYLGRGIGGGHNLRPNQSVAETVIFLDIQASEIASWKPSLDAVRVEKDNGGTTNVTKYFQLKEIAKGEKNEEGSYEDQESTESIEEDFLDNDKQAMKKQITDTWCKYVRLNSEWHRTVGLLSPGVGYNSSAIRDNLNYQILSVEGQYRDLMKQYESTYGNKSNEQLKQDLENECPGIKPF